MSAARLRTVGQRAHRFAQHAAARADDHERDHQRHPRGDQCDNGADQRVPPGADQGADRRGGIEEFSAKGFAGARVSETARRAGVNQQLIAYYFDGKEGLYRELGRQWRQFEAETFPDDMSCAELIKGYVRTSVDNRRGGEERDAHPRHEVEQIRARQEAGELEDRDRPGRAAADHHRAANTLAVYPQLARELLGGDGSSPEVVERYAEQLALLLAKGDT